MKDYRSAPPGERGGMLADRCGLSLSTSSQVARDAYVEGID
jgi:hypothetical protein